MEDLSVDALTVKDESSYQRDGSIKRERVYRFYLGKHGPFVERVAIDGFDPQAIQRCIDQLRAQLQNGPR